MKRLLYLLWSLLLVVPGYGQDSNAEAKAQINKIKKNAAYLYGEATLATPDEALSLAREILGKEIEALIQEKKKLRNSNNVVVRNMSEVSQQMTLPRGNMYRAFVYVKKSDIIPSENATVVNVEKQADTEVNARAEENAAGVTGTSASEAVLKTVLGLSDFTQLKECLTTLKREGKISDYGKYASLAQPSDYYLIIYNRTGQIEAVLAPGTDTRMNLKTRQADSVANYKGRGAIGFKL